jgi:hypothetical protein
MLSSILWCSFLKLVNMTCTNCKSTTICTYVNCKCRMAMTCKPMHTISIAYPLSLEFPIQGARNCDCNGIIIPLGRKSC